MNRSRFFILIIFLILVFSGCQYRQDLHLHDDGSGTALISIELSPMFSDYLFSLSGAFDDNEGQIFDLEEIEESFKATPGLTLNGLKSPSAGELSLDITIEDVSSLFNQSGDERGLLSLTQEGNREVLSFLLTPETISQFLAISPMAENPLLASLAPQPNNPISKEEYLDLFEYAFEEFAGEKGVSSQVRESGITLNVFTQNRILRHDGGILIDKGILYDIPLLDILTLSDPLEYRVEMVKR